MIQQKRQTSTVIPVGFNSTYYYHTACRYKMFIFVDFVHLIAGEEYKRRQSQANDHSGTNNRQTDSLEYSSLQPSLYDSDILCTLDHCRVSHFTMRL